MSKVAPYLITVAVSAVTIALVFRVAAVRKVVTGA